jgi:hypothetical protein
MPHCGQGRKDYPLAQSESVVKISYFKVFKRH